MNRPAVLFLALILAGAVFAASLEAGPVEACVRAIVTLVLLVVVGAILTRKK